MSYLVVNAGSSSMKFGLFDAEAKNSIATGLIDWTADSSRAELVIRLEGEADRHLPLDPTQRHKSMILAVREMTACSLVKSFRAVGHRVVHGGAVFRESVRIDGVVKAEIVRLSELAPLHNPPALEALEAVEEALPSLPQVAVFDTAFFSRLPPVAHVYPLPYEWYADWGVRRFGFHGISHAYCSRRATEMLARDSAKPRLVICHLGNGCSASAVKEGDAVATTMGYTPLEGLMMGARSGSVDPGILIHVMKHRGLSPDHLDHLLNHGSGLLGVSGVSSDYRQVDSAAHSGNDRARLALDMYARSIRSTVGALAVTLGGVDALVFTAGVGENAAGLREMVCQGLECLGLRLDHERNARCRPDADISTTDSPGRILVIHTREDLLIARETKRILGEVV